MSRVTPQKHINAFYLNKHQITDLHSQFRKFLGVTPSDHHTEGHCSTFSELLHAVAETEETVL